MHFLSAHPVPSTCEGASAGLDYSHLLPCPCRQACSKGGGGAGAVGETSMRSCWALIGDMVGAAKTAGTAPGTPRHTEALAAGGACTFCILQLLVFVCIKNGIFLLCCFTFSDEGAVRASDPDFKVLKGFRPEGVTFATVHQSSITLPLEYTT